MERRIWIHIWSNKPWKPGVKNIWILIYFNIFPILLVSFFNSFFRAPSNYVFLFTVFAHNVPNWYAVSPP